MDTARAFIDEAITTSENYRQQAERAFAQLSDAGFLAVPAEGSNSVAILVKHIGGNLRTRWRDFLTTDGEKADRDRDSEFIITAADSRTALMTRWEEGWNTFFAALHSLHPEDLGKTITIRGQPMTALQAILRAVTHAAGHISQIVYIAKWHAGDTWKTLSIERGKSEDYNRSLGYNPRR